ncbi:MAG: glycosyltransferase [Actinomycetota bacterium]
MEPRVDVLVVNHDTRDRLRDCLHAIRGQDDLRQIRVADNGSSDGSLDMLRSEFPDVDTISLPHNPGFGAGVNALAERSDAPVLVVLNADARPEPGALTTLADHLADHPEAAVVGPRLSDEDGSLQRSCFPDADVRELLWQESGLHRWRRGGLAAFDHASEREVPWVLGAAFAVRRSAFEEVGRFDPGFFLYYEEVDLCRRLRRPGWTVRFAPDATVVHVGGASTGRSSAFAQRAHYRSLRRYHELHGTARAGSLRAATTLIMLARLARDLALGMGRGERARAARANRRVWSTVLRDAWRNDSSASSAAGRTGDEPARRLDWLALLPEPIGTTSTPSLTIVGRVGAHDRNAIARHLGASTSTDRLDPPSDVVVALGDEIPIGRVLDAIADDGIGYVARTGRMWRGAVRLERAARRQGLHVVGRYWVLPDAATPRRHVPLDHRGAIRWYLDRLLIPAGAVQRVLRRLVRTLPWLTPLAARHHAIVVARRPGARPAFAAFDVGGGDPRLGSTSEPADRAIVMTSGHDLGSRTIVMPFEPGAGSPSRVVKIAGSTALNEATRREHDALVAVRSLMPVELAASVPTPLLLDVWRERAVAVETCVDGPTLDVAMRLGDERIAISWLEQVGEWLVAFHRHTAERVVLDEAMVDQWFAAPFARYCDTGDDPLVAALLDRAASHALGLVGTEVPLVRRHVDLAPWNIVTSDGGIGVLDWESAGGRPADGRGLPFCDLDYFIKFWLHVVLRADDEAQQDGLFGLLAPVPSTGPRIAAAVDRQLDRYVDVLDLDRRLLPSLSVHGWVEQCLYGADRSSLLDVPARSHASSRRLRALAAHADALFP